MLNASCAIWNVLVALRDTGGQTEIPAGVNTRPVSQGSRERDPFCSVCLNENLSEAEVEVRREMEREVRLIQSKPSVAYRKHSPSNWSQEDMMGNIIIVNEKQIAFQAHMSMSS